MNGIVLNVKWTMFISLKSAEQRQQRQEYRQQKQKEINEKERNKEENSALNIPIEPIDEPHNICAIHVRLVECSSRLTKMPF